MRIGIVGAGMAGLACAEGLANRGHDVVLFDKGRGPGGRMSTRRLATAAGEACFDHGAQYFTARDDAFRRRVDDWIIEGVVAPWPSAGSEAYVGVPTMNAPLRAMAAGQRVLWTTCVQRLDEIPGGHGVQLVLDRGDAVALDMVLVATPAEQAAALLASFAPALAARAGAVPSEPCWTLLLAFSQALPVAVNCWRGGDVIGWAARNGSKPGRPGPESWVVQAGPDWSRTHLEADPEWVAAALTRELATLLGSVLPPALAHCSHRWRFARCGVDGSGAIWDRERRVGVCGDWLIGPRVEAAWLSGTALAELIGAAEPTSRALPTVSG